MFLFGKKMGGVSRERHFVLFRDNLAEDSPNMMKEKTQRVESAKTTR